ncbi:hypothetical protein PsYK624_029170 [Phanerochaete sordida]|uniref:Uncharacterized protein n=1 Tax=Phanerochaete sordida TaxID=48140 RepID=A0A9P3G2T4_9APHY|nr:hypothetical protein PsYK624_029170 [Phanerochaete sordida]
MSWPAYTAFMFSSTCQNCGRGSCEAMFWDCLARYCPYCKLKISVLHTRKYDAVRTLGTALEGVNIPFPLDQIPLHFAIPVMDTEQKKFEGDGIMEAFKQHEGWSYSRIELDKLRASMTTLPPEDVFGFIQAKAKALRTRRDQTPSLVQWKKEDKALRAGERQQLLNSRYESIRQKLVELGWEEELDILGPRALSLHPLVAQAKSLTDRIWANIRPQLVALLFECQQDRLAEERAPIIEQRKAVLDDVVHAIEPKVRYRAAPSLYEVAVGIPRVLDTLKLPPDVAVTAESFAFLATELPDFVEQWTIDICEQLESRIRAKIDLAADTEPLRLAIASSWRCIRCSRHLRTQEFTAHRCYTHPKPVVRTRDYCKELLADMLPTHRLDLADFADEVEFLQQIVAKCGHDPKTATVAEMNASSARVTCPMHNPEGAVCFMTWKTMIAHVRQNMWALPSCGLEELEAVPEQFCAAARPLEEGLAQLDREFPAAKHRGLSIWRCGICLDTPPEDYLDVEDHMMRHHRRLSAADADNIVLAHEGPIVLDESRREELDLDQGFRSYLDGGLAAFATLDQGDS